MMSPSSHGIDGVNVHGPIPPGMNAEGDGIDGVNICGLHTILWSCSLKSASRLHINLLWPVLILGEPIRILNGSL